MILIRLTFIPFHDDDRRVWLHDDDILFHSRGWQEKIVFFFLLRNQTTRSRFRLDMAVTRRSLKPPWKFFVFVPPSPPAWHLISSQGSRANLFGSTEEREGSSDSDTSIINKSEWTKLKKKKELTVSDDRRDVREREVQLDALGRSTCVTQWVFL